MQKTVIVGYARTPFGRFLGGLKDLSAVELGGIALKVALQRAGVEPSQVDYLFMGMVLQAGCGQIPSRQAGRLGGLPWEASSDTVNKVCASGLRAVNLADALIRVGDIRVAAAGGMESMSRAPYLLPQGREGMRMGPSPVEDAMIKDGLWCPFYDVHMGVHGSEVAAEFGITREAQDRWALRSQQLAVRAQDEGRFDGEIHPVEVAGEKGQKTLISQDELPRRDVSLERLAALPPVFQKDGMITAGNAPPISDGAAALVLMGEEAARRAGLEPLAEIVSQGYASARAPYIATVPALAAEEALRKAGLTAADIGLIEVNEAFAAVALTSIQLGRWDPEVVNVNGGAIALGHPIGASGARVLMTLAEEMKRRKVTYGMAAICSGAAQGEATILKLC